MKRKYSSKQKAQIVLEMIRGEKTNSQISAEYGVHASQLYKWREQVLKGIPDIFEGKGKTEKTLQVQHDKQTDELYSEIGKLTTQLNWLKKKSGIEPFER